MKKLLSIALIWVLVGLIILIYLSQSYVPPHTKIILLQDKLGKTVEVTGELTRVSPTEKATFLTLKDSTASITVVAFEEVTGLEKGDLLRVIGTVEIYKNKLEIIAKEIKRL